MPCFIFSLAAISRKPFSSSSNSWPTCSFRNSDRTPPAMFRNNASVLSSIDMVHFLFVAQGDHRVDARGATCGDVARRERHDDEQSGGTKKGKGVSRANAEELTF